MGAAWITVNRHPSTSDLTAFGRAMVLGFALLGAAAWLAPAWTGGASSLKWDGRSAQWLAGACWAAGLSLFIAARGPVRVARPVYVAWMTVAACMGTVLSTVLLTVLFVLFLPAFSLVVRRSDPLRKRLNKRDASYWEPCQPLEPSLDRLRRLF